jgi:predicted nucleic acid-binding protein
MPAYFDSSVLVAMATNERHAQGARDRWSAEQTRVSSILLAIECENVVWRRSATDASLAARAKPLLEAALSEITLKNVDEDVLKIVRTRPVLARCRSLDAVHLATALHFAGLSDEPMVMITFDARMAEVAAAVGLRVLGAG